jgi:hypothetical protein
MYLERHLDVRLSRVTAMILLCSSYKGLWSERYEKAQCFLIQRRIQRELIVYRFSKDTTISLKNIVHLGEYTQELPLQMGMLGEWDAGQNAVNTVV